MFNCHPQPKDTVECHYTRQTTINFNTTKRINNNNILRIQLPCRSMLRPRVTQPHAKKRHTARPPKKATHQIKAKNQMKQTSVEIRGTMCITCFLPKGPAGDLAPLESFLESRVSTKIFCSSGSASSSLLPSPSPRTSPLSLAGSCH